MPQTVYLETSIISYLAARPSRDLIAAAHQQTTHTWWQTRRLHFDIYVSQHVLNEPCQGDEEAVRKRMRLLKDLPRLTTTPEVTNLAEALITEKILPVNAAGDAAHIATSALHEMDFLLTWNCRHLANAEIRRLISAFLSRGGWSTPIICTTEELLGE